MTSDFTSRTRGVLRSSCTRLIVVARFYLMVAGEQGLGRCGDVVYIVTPWSVTDSFCLISVEFFFPKGGRRMGFQRYLFRSIVQWVFPVWTPLLLVRSNGNAGHPAQASVRRLIACIVTPRVGSMKTSGTRKGMSGPLLLLMGCNEADRQPAQGSPRCLHALRCSVPGSMENRHKETVAPFFRPTHLCVFIPSK